ncbi:MAG: cellulase family glycosylhydrolase [Halococcoides sp.]
MGNRNRSEGTRRQFLATVGAGAAAGLIGATSSVTAVEGSFVRRDGSDLLLDGAPIALHGANNFWITDSYRGTPDRIDELFGMFEEMNIDMVRTFASCEGGDGACYMPEPYEHSPEALEMLDYVIDSASRHGIRLNLVLADNWDHNGGAAQYVDWVDGAEVHGDFFDNEDVKDLYKWHVEDLLTRTNSVSDVEYRNDPAIVSWELCNEPRIEGDAFGEGEDPGHEQRAQILEDWLAEMAAFVGDLDDEHLISTGLEGFYTRENRTGWYYSTWTGQDYERHNAIDGIDLASFHMYPHHWDIPLEYCSTWIREHVHTAHEVLDKPAYLGEFNVNVSGRSDAQCEDPPAQVDERNAFLEEWYEVADAYNCDAATIWQIVVPDMHDHDGFQVYRCESGDVLAEYADATDARSPGFGRAGADTLHAPTAIDAVTTGGSIDCHWSAVPAASAYEVTIGEETAAIEETSVTRSGLMADREYDVSVTPVGADGSTGDPITTTVTTEGPETVDAPAWEEGVAFEGGDRSTHHGILWEAQWHTDEETPRFESGYDWEMVRELTVPQVSSRAWNVDPVPTTTETTTETAPDRPTWPEGATDPDGDGLFEDLSGNEKTDFPDVNELFQNADSATVQDNTQFYDFTDDGSVDLQDVLALFEMV